MRRKRIAIAVRETSAMSKTQQFDDLAFFGKEPWMWSRNNDRCARRRSSTKLVRWCVCCKGRLEWDGGGRPPATTSNQEQVGNCKNANRRATTTGLPFGCCSREDGHFWTVSCVRCVCFVWFGLVGSCLRVCGKQTVVRCDCDVLLHLHVLCCVCV